MLAAEHLARMLDEHSQQLELAGGHPHRLAGDEHLVRGQIDLEAAEAKPPRPRRAPERRRTALTRATTSAGVAT